VTEHRHDTIGRADADSATGSGGTANLGEMRADIDDTRREMGNTLNELGDRLEPGHLVDQAKENLRDATIGRVEESVRGTSDMVLDTIKRNPIPSTMAGVGLAMLWKNRGQAGRGGTVSYGPDYGYPNRPASMYDGPRRDDLGSKVTDAASGIGDSVTNAASTVGDTVGGVAGTAKQATGEVVGRAGETAQQAGWKLENFMQANPLAMGAIAVGVGAVAASLLPSTEPERGMLGDASRQVSSTIRDTVQDVTAKAEQIADDAEVPAAPSA
jgi:hypothetical protein